MISQAGARARIRMFGEITREGKEGMWRIIAINCTLNKQHRNALNKSQQFHSNPVAIFVLNLGAFG